MKYHNNTWEVHDCSDIDLKNLSEAGFRVWTWKNSNRITIKGTSRNLTRYYLVNKSIKCKLQKKPYPDPDGNILAKEVNHE